jgi:PAS domain S-box-containing protein
MLSRFRIGPRLALAMGLTLSIFIATLVILWLALLRHVDETEQVREESVPLMLTAEHMVLDVAEIQQWLTDVGATRDRSGYIEAQRHATTFMSGLELFKAHFMRLNDQQQVDELEQLGKRFQTFYDLGKRMAEAYVVHGTAGGNQTMRRFDKESRELQLLIDQFEAQNLALTMASAEAVVNSARLMQNLIIASGILVILIGTLIAVLITRSITRPIAQALSVANSVAAGNLSYPIQPGGKDEPGRLLESMARMQANLRKLLANRPAGLGRPAGSDSENAWQAAEQSLRQTAREFEDLYQNAPCGYHTLDARGRLLRINATEIAWLGQTRLSMLAKTHYRELLTAASRERFEQQFAEFVADGEPFELELDYVRADGSNLSVQASFSAVYDEAGEFVMARCTVYDLTEQKQREQERKQRDEERIQREHERAEQAKHIENLSRNLIAVQEQERRKLSSELHDHTGANLAALNTYIKIISARLPDPLPKELEKVFADSHHVLEDTIQSVRTICSELRPTILDYAGLQAAVDNYAQLFERRTGIKVHLHLSEWTAKLSSERETNLYRLMQEALSNVARHAQAKEVGIELVVSDEVTRLVIVDDGKGFDANRVGVDDNQPHLGLITMRERCEFIGGTFTVDSAPGEGTVIQVELPPEPKPPA